MELIDPPDHPTFDNSRKPLIGEFSYQGRTFFFIVNHFNSEFADQVSDHEPQRVCFEKGASNCPVPFP